MKINRRFSILNVIVPFKNGAIIGIQLVFAISILISCKKLVEVDPPITSINEENVYASDQTAISVLTGMYADLTSSSFILTGGQGLSIKAGLSADEFKLFDGIAGSSNLSYYYTNSLYSNLSGSQGTDFWSPFYNKIFVCNAAIEGLSKSSSLSPFVKQQLLGESKFMRAFFYFYLVNLYGDVPLILTTNWQINTSISRTDKTEVYKQIAMDLQDAEELLYADYVNENLAKYSGSPERVRPTKWAAIALLARTYLYSGEWAKAEEMSTKIINNTSLFNLNKLDEVFLKNSREAIWQLQPTNLNWNTEEAQVFLLNSSPQGLNSDHPVFLDTLLVKSYEFADKRKTNWISSYTDPTGTFYFPTKYKSATQGQPLTEYLMMLRLAEQYLIRAEARAQQGKTSEAAEDLNAIRRRAELSDYSGPTDQVSLLNAIYHERRLEFMSEWGHRWFDLKRTAKINEVMNIVSPLKGGTWQSYKQLYPILFSDIQKNSSLSQNTGY